MQKRKKNNILHILLFWLALRETRRVLRSADAFPVSSAQTYVGRKRAAVDRVCVGVPAGEVKSPSSFTLRAAATVFSQLFFLH